MEEELFITTWRNKWITSEANSIDDFITTFESLAKKFREWKEMGIKLLDDGSVGDDYATFGTDDMNVAIKAGFTITYVGDKKKKQYLQTIFGKDIEVPREKLENSRKI